MRITKFGHSCVRVEHDGHVVVLDPGVLSEREALEGATAVLITHEHPDHVDPAHLVAVPAPVFTIAAVAATLPDEVRERTTIVAPGESFDVGLSVRAVGEKHAVIHPDFPHFDNSGFVISAGDQRLFHPGDAFTPPGEPVDVLCLPVCAPWAKISEVLDYARAHAAPRVLAIHDKVYSDFGLSIVDPRVQDFIGEQNVYSRLASGVDLT